MLGDPRRQSARVAAAHLLVAMFAVAVVAGCSPASGGSVTTTSPSSSPSPRPTSTPDPAEQAAVIVSRLSDVDLVGQVLMPSVNLSDPAAVPAALVSKYHLGGLILMGDVENTASPVAPGGLAGSPR